MIDEKALHQITTEIASRCDILRGLAGLSEQVVFSCYKWSKISRFNCFIAQAGRSQQQAGHLNLNPDRGGIMITHRSCRRRLVF
jgi:hypothetical protein